MVALSALTVFSCSKSQDALDTPVKGKVLVAYTDDNVITRTALQNEVNVIWNSTDAITGFDINGVGHQSQSITVDSQNASKATFQFGDDLSVVDDIFYALYPADASATMNENCVITTTLPVSQVATAGSFGPGANIALADGGKEDLHFSNGGALLSFTVNNDNVKKVKLTVSGDYNVAGPVYASMESSGDALVQSASVSPIKSVSLEGDFVNGSDYYFVVLPGEYTGLQLDIENAEGKVATLKNRNALSLNRNDNIYIANLPDLTAKWEADTPSLPDKVFFMETFGGDDNSLGTGGAAFEADNEVWSVENAYLAGADGHSGRFGSRSAQGVATTPSISINSDYNGQTLTLSFKAAAWSGDATTLNLSATGATLSATSVTLKDNDWDEYEISITNWTSPFTITFSGKQASRARFFLDDVCVYYGAQSGGGSGPSTVKAVYEFNGIPGFDEWGTSYSEHTVEYTEATVVFASANHQTSTITDVPVTKGQEVSLVLKSAVASSIKNVKFVCRQWGTKTQTITLHRSTDGGQTYTSTGITSNNFKISGTNLPEGTNAVKITFNNSSNQVGIESAEIDYYPAQ